MTVLVELEAQQVELTKKLLTRHIEDLSEAWDRLYITVSDIREHTTNVKLQNADWSSVFALMREEIDNAIKTREAITYEEKGYVPDDDFGKMDKLGM